MGPFRMCSHFLHRFPLIEFTLLLRHSFLELRFTCRRIPLLGVYSSVLRVFVCPRRMGQSSPQLILGHFHHHEKETQHPWAVTPHFPPTNSPALGSLGLSVSKDVPFWIFQRRRWKWDHMIHSLLWLPSFTYEQHVFKAPQVVACTGTPVFFWPNNTPWWIGHTFCCCLPFFY